MAHLGCRYPHELVDRGLRRRVVDDAAVAHDPRDRPGRNDGPRLAGRHHGPRGLAQAQEHAPDVDAMDAVPLVRAHLQDRRHAAHPRRQDGDPRRAQLVDDPLHRGDDVILVAHVAFHRQVALSLVRLQVEDGDPSAPVAQTRCGRGADATRAAGHEGDGSVEVQGRHGNVPSCRLTATSGCGSGCSCPSCACRSTRSSSGRWPPRRPGSTRCG